MIRRVASIPYSLEYLVDTMRFALAQFQAYAETTSA